MTYYEYHKLNVHDDIEQTYYDVQDDQPVLSVDGEEEPYGYPTETSRNLVNGELADRIRKALQVSNTTEVYIIEETGDESYSEYTQGQYHYFRVEADGHVREFHENAFGQMMQWLDKEAPV